MPKGLGGEGMPKWMSVVATGDPARFLEEYEFFATARRWSEQNRIELFRAAMGTEVGKQWYHTCLTTLAARGAEGSWAEWREAFLVKMQGENYTSDVMAAFVACKQKAGEDIEEYQVRFQRIEMQARRAGVLNMDTKALISSWIAGLYYSYRAQVHTSSPATMELALQLARYLESERRKSGSTSRGSDRAVAHVHALRTAPAPAPAPTPPAVSPPVVAPSPSPSSAPSPAPHANPPYLPHPSMYMAGPAPPFSLPFPPGYSPYAPPAPYPTPYHPPSPSPTPPVPSPAAARCPRCGRNTHTVDQCRVPADRVCYNCNTAGHLSTACPQPRRPRPVVPRVVAAPLNAVAEVAAEAGEDAKTRLNE